MVKLFCVSLLCVATLAQAIDFRMELSKNKFYPGEQITADYILSAPDPLLEVEVVKFPEFRNFWSENRTLRQGPLPLMPGFGANSLPQVSIGTYLLSSMVGKKDLLIQPMKIAVRRPGETEFQNLSSRLPPYQVLPLPPLPASDKSAFHGAVGTFTLTSDKTSLGFHKDEPIALRVALQGQGNFSEIDDLPRNFPKDVEVLSKRTYTQGEGAYQSKVFEWTIAIHVEERVDIPESLFLFFNPDSAHYERLTLPAVELLALPPAALEGSTHVTLPMETDWHRGWDLSHSRLFFWLQIAIALLLAGYLAWRQFQALWTKRISSPRFQRARKWKHCLAQYRAGQREEFLRLAAEITEETLLEGVGERHSWVSRAELLQRAEKRLPASLLPRIRSLFSAYESLAYGPEKKAPADLSPFVETLTELRAARFSPAQNA